MRPCLSRSDLRRFEFAGEDILGDHAFFTPPVPGSVREFFDPRLPFRRIHGEIAGFLAERDGRVVGRIAAILNRSHNAFHGDGTGFFGFFDFVNDPAVSAALWREAAGWLRRHGCTSVRGPYNPTINEECGLLVEGYDDPPAVFMPWQPPYYRGHYEALGLVPVRRMLGFHMDMRPETAPRIRRVAERARRQTGITVRPFRLQRLQDELRILQRLYNCTLDRNWGYVPVAWEDLQHSAKGLKAIADPNLLFFGIKDGGEIAFSISLPDINENLRAVRRWPRSLRLVAFAWKLHTHRPSRARHCILGIDPEHRHKGGIAALFYEQTFERVRGGGFPVAEVSWVEENNTEIVRSITLLGGRTNKVLAIFERQLEEVS